MSGLITWNCGKWLCHPRALTHFNKACKDQTRCPSTIAIATCFILQEKLGPRPLMRFPCKRGAQPTRISEARRTPPSKTFRRLENELLSRKLVANASASNRLFFLNARIRKTCPQNKEAPPGHYGGKKPYRFRPDKVALCEVNRHQIRLSFLLLPFR